ncbi:MAG: glycosyltransferase family 2 protein [Candidatus Omnitrophica bacterium]|nr:glycosyltransferase family 2 protein [Candidatus Omnitrophota bacterium]
MKNRKTISIVIPVYNAADKIKNCLESLAWADEIIIVDMFSDDGTVEICRKSPKVKIIQRHDYIFANVNFGIEAAISDWIMRLDSDEVITEGLKEEILNVLKQDGCGYDGFYCKARLFMFGREIKYGVGRHTYRKQLFRKGYAWYEVKSEHEEMLSKGEWNHLKNPYLHYNYNNVNEFFEKTKYYTQKDAERSCSINRFDFFRTIYKSIRFFILYYLQWQGFRDGTAGLTVSFLRGPYYIWQEYKARRKLYEDKNI